MILSWLRFVICVNYDCGLRSGLYLKMVDDFIHMYAQMLSRVHLFATS